LRLLRRRHCDRDHRFGRLQRTLTIAPEKAPAGFIAVAVIRPRNGGAGFKYSIPTAALALLGLMNAQFDAHKRYDAVMQADGLFQVEPVE
jgi:hypothetical protein